MKIRLLLGYNLTLATFAFTTSVQEPVLTTQHEEQQRPMPTVKPEKEKALTGLMYATVVVR